MSSEKTFGKIYSALAFASMFFVVSGFIVPMYSGGAFSFVIPIAFFGVLAVMLIGYFLQAMFSAMFRFERKHDDRAYESTVKYFVLTPALPVIFMGIVIAAFGVSPMHEIYYQITVHSHNPNIYYDQHSLVPYVWASSLAFLLVFGAVLWFFPYQRFARLKMPLVCLPILFIASFLTMQTGTGAWVSAVSLFGYTLCTMILMNQTNLEKRTMSIEEVTFMSGRARMYNLMMTSSLMVIYFVVAFVLLVVLVGLATIGKFLLALLLFRMNDEDEIREVTQSEVQAFVFGDTVRERASNSILFSVFLILGALVVLYFMTRKNDLVSRLLSAIKRFIMSIIDFFFLYGDVREKDEEGFVSYKDEERKRQKGKISRYTKKIAATKTYRDFLVKLNSFRSNSEKLEFAYATLYSRLVKEHAFVKTSDTPRTVAAKLRQDPYYEGIDDITFAFEQVAYAELGMDNVESERAIETLCALVHRHLE